MGGQVDPRAGLDTLVKRKIPSPCWESDSRILTIQPIELINFFFSTAERACSFFSGSLKVMVSNLISSINLVNYIEGTVSEMVTKICAIHDHVTTKQTINFTNYTIK
jgi:hypothetical protein